MTARPHTLRSQMTLATAVCCLLGAVLLTAPWTDTEGMQGEGVAVGACDSIAGHDHGGVDEEVVCRGEPSAPPVLEVVRDGIDGESVQIRVRAGLAGLGGPGGQGRLVVENEEAFEWEGARGTGRVMLRRGDGDRVFRLRRRAMVRPTARPTARQMARAKRVRVGLIIEDEAGRPAFTIHREVSFDQETEAEVGIELRTGGRAADGTPLLVSTPVGAPVPRVDGRQP